MANALEKITAFLTAYVPEDEVRQSEERVQHALSAHREEVDFLLAGLLFKHPTAYGLFVAASFAVVVAAFILPPNALFCMSLTMLILSVTYFGLTIQKVSIKSFINEALTHVADKETSYKSFVRLLATIRGGVVAFAKSKYANPLYVGAALAGLALVSIVAPLSTLVIVSVLAVNAIPVYHISVAQSGSSSDANASNFGGSRVEADDEPNVPSHSFKAPSVNLESHEEPVEVHPVEPTPDPYAHHVADPVPEAPQHYEADHSPSVGTDYEDNYAQPQEPEHEPELIAV